MIKLASTLFCFLFLFVGLCRGQQTITGKVSSAKTGASLPFATVSSGQDHLFTTDMTGEFSVELEAYLSFITVNYPGFKTQQVRIPNNGYLHIFLEKKNQSDPLTLREQETKTANELLSRVIAKKTVNIPEHTLESFTFNSYQKSLITADPDSINGAIDSVFKVKKEELRFREVDSGNYYLKKQLLRTHLYLTETAVRVDYHRSEGRKETILGHRMAGLEEPLHRLLKFQLQSFSLYKESYTLLGTTYKSPLARNALKTYDYRILDTVTIQNRPGYVIHFYPKREPKRPILEGVLYIDTTSLALQKGKIQLREGLDINATQNYSYYPEQDLWFPVRADLKLKKGKGKQPVDLFDRTIIKVNEPSSDSSYYHTNSQFPYEQLLYIAEQNNSDILFNKPVSIQKRVKDIFVNPDASTKNESFWKKKRELPLTEREQYTYNELDSIALADRVNARLEFLNKLFTGYLPTRYVDFDLKYLIKYNNYEAFRLGMGAITNNNFSKRLRLKAYGVYGTKDDDFKYGFTGSYKLSQKRNTWFAVDYKDDLVETGSDQFLTEGRTFYVFEPRLFNITSFHRSKALSTYIDYEVNPALRLRWQWSQAETQPTYPYLYVLDNNTFSQYATNTATFSLYWAPNNTYLTYRDGNSLLTPGFPQFNFQVTQGIKGIMGSDFSFTKAKLRIRHRINTFGAGAIDLNLTGGLGFGDLPITELYHASPNQPKAEALLSRFSVAGRDSFETMYFDEFFSDRYFSFQAKYLAPPFKITEKINPQLIFITRYALGDIRNPENHLGIPFNALNRGYYESGLEFNNIFSGFGLSTMYRYGPYGLPLFTDNISLKFTFYLSLGI